jgi:hypothetical protein
LALNEPKQVALHSNSSTNSENAPQVGNEIIDTVSKNNHANLIGDELPTRSPIDLKDDFNLPVDTLMINENEIN